MKRQCGMTLVELILTIVIVGIAAAALFSAMASIGGRSADPMLRQQSLAIAEAYLEEINLQAFPTSTACTSSNNGNNRATFDNACAYNGLTYGGSQPFAPRGPASTTPLTGLTSYQVTVSVSASALNGIASSDALRILVTVTDPSGQSLSLAGYRARY